MRLTHLEVESFGGFERHAWSLTGEVNVLLGMNEAGKSTLLAAIETLLYGFEPATLERHPLARPGDGPIVLRGTFEIGDAGSPTRIEVLRKLASRPTLRVSESHGQEDAGDGQKPAEITGPTDEGNRPLREVRSTSRELFRAVYSLSSSQLTALDGNVRAAAEELLLGESAIAGLRPVETVLDELRTARQALWRPDNRGKPLARALRVKLSEARKTYHTARALDDALRDGTEREAEWQRELGRAKVRRDVLDQEEADAAFLSEARELSLRRKALGSTDLSALAGDPLEDPRELERERSELYEAMAEHATRLEQTLELTSTHRRILDRAGAIEAVRTTRGRYEARQEAVEEVRDRLRQAESENLVAWSRLAGGKPNRSHLSRLRGFPVELLRAQLAAWEEAREQAAGRSSTPWRGWAAALAGTAVVVATSLQELAPGFVALGLTLLFLAYLELRLRTASRTQLAAPAEIRESLAQLELSSDLASTPHALARLIEQLETASARFDELEAIEDRTLALARELEVQEEEWELLLEELGLSTGEHLSGSEMAARLDDALVRARDLETRVRADHEERRRAKAILDAHRPRLERIEGRLARLQSALRRNVPLQPDLSLACRTLHERLRKTQYAEDRLRELRANPRWPRLMESGPIDEGLIADEAQAEREREVQKLDERVAEIHRMLGELAAERRASPPFRVAEAREEIAAIEAEQNEVRREHDRLALAEGILAYAGRAWREAHQPDVLRLASGYLEAISDGRYIRLDYPEDAEGGLAVFDDAGDVHAADFPLSRGTRDQIYLALRLGLLDHLDAGRAPLPLILDEALVHWDAGRRARLYPLLERVTRRRQVLVTTCHPAFASEAADAMDVPVERLAAPRAESPQRG